MVDPATTQITDGSGVVLCDECFESDPVVTDIEGNRKANVSQTVANSPLWLQTETKVEKYMLDKSLVKPKVNTPSASSEKTLTVLVLCKGPSTNGSNSALLVQANFTILAEAGKI